MKDTCTHAICERTSLHYVRMYHVCQFGYGESVVLLLWNFAGREEYNTPPHSLFLSLPLLSLSLPPPPLSLSQAASLSSMEDYAHLMTSAWTERRILWLRVAIIESSLVTIVNEIIKNAWFVHYVILYTKRGGKFPVSVTPISFSGYFYARAPEMRTPL